MPPAARRDNKGKGPRQPVAAPKPDMVTVRMLYGERAGQVVQVTRSLAVELCGGWQPRAELVSLNPAERRETR